MTLFDDISEKDISAVDFMSRANRKLIAAFLSERKSRRLTKAKLAELLGVNRSAVTRMLKGKANLTERTIGELAWALGYRADLKLERIEVGNERRFALEERSGSERFSSKIESKNDAKAGGNVTEYRPALESA